VDGLSVHHQHHEILKDLTFNVQQGRVLSVMGPNGGGKTTLFQTLAGIKKVHAGHWGWMTQDGEKQPLAKGDWAYLPQRFYGDRSFPLRVSEFLKISYPVLNDARVRELLAMVKLENYANARIQALSEGQFQRLLFARLCACPTPLIFLDEPFSGLDETIIDDLLGIIQAWKNQGRIILLSHHNRSRALSHFPETLLLAREKYAYGPSQEVLTPDLWQLCHDSICRPECC
jgi:zinc/manganese transport system ATP-binding protein